MGYLIIPASKEYGEIERMKIGLVGDGGREHAIARKIAESSQAELFVAAKNINHGIRSIAKGYAQLNMTDLDGIVAYFEQNQVGLVVIGPEATLIAGIVDKLRAKGILAVGPTQQQARLEGDKSFMRYLLNEKIGWGSPAWKLVASIKEAEAFIRSQGEVVVKPVGLTGGRGVRVMGVQLKDINEALSFIQELLETNSSVLLEEKVIGQEFSRLAFICDGKVIPMPVMQDFKYAYDGDKGMMTGGMGTYSFADGKMPFLTSDEIKTADKLLEEVIAALEKETGEPYRGFLYGQFMITRSGLRLIEFNVRLGDPEALNVNALLEGDSAQLFEKLASGKLSKADVQFKPMASVVKYLVPEEYPAKLTHDYFFNLDENKVSEADFTLIQASVMKTGETEWKALGSRTMAIVGLGQEAAVLAEKIDALIDELKPQGLRYRKDVGNRDNILQKVEMMDRIRGVRK